MARKKVLLGNVEISENSKPYFIAEIGINHNGDIQIAKKLLDATFLSGWDCAKFQKRTPEIAVPEKQKHKMRSTPWGEMEYIDYKKKIEFEKPEYDRIDEYCRQKPLKWTASPWDIPSLEFLLQYDIPFIKIPSAKNGDEELIKKAGESEKTIIASTGMTTLEETDLLVDRLEKYADGNYILMHTNSTYPSPYSEINLKVIRTLKERYGCLVGYSGHEGNLEPTVAAAILGACVIERHITLDHDMWGSDQKASLEVQAMKWLKTRVDVSLSALGNGEKVLFPSELKKREELRGQ